MEYEYSITNGDFDIDRIIGKSKRERMITTNCQSFSEMGVYSKEIGETLKERNFGAKVMAANLDAKELYYIVVDHNEIGNVLVVIQPDERIKRALKRFVPRTVQGDLFINK